MVGVLIVWQKSNPKLNQFEEEEEKNNNNNNKRFYIVDFFGQHCLISIKSFQCDRID